MYFCKQCPLMPTTPSREFNDYSSCTLSHSITAASKESLDSAKLAFYFVADTSLLPQSQIRTQSLQRGAELALIHLL